MDLHTLFHEITSQVVRPVRAAEAFIALRGRREEADYDHEEADYDHEAIFTRPDTLLSLAEARAAIRVLRQRATRCYFGLIAMQSSIRR